MKTLTQNEKFAGIFSILVIFSFLLTLNSCGGGANTGSSASTSPEVPVAPAFDTLAVKGVGPITSYVLQDLDLAMAAKGKAIFDSKCNSCHKINERYVGPALIGVTKRRSPEWILNQILAPEKMTKEDPIAKGLFEQYMTQMTFQNVTEDDAKQLLEYLRSIESPN